MNSQSNSNKSKKKRKKWSTKKRILVTSITIFALILTIIFGGYLYIKSKIYVTGESKNNSNKEYTEVKGITNVLLIGTDARNLEENSRSDSIIIATLDNNNKVIKLTSLFRDTLVNIPGYGESKINAAYALGGADLLKETIRETYDINIDKYIVINFWGFEAIIDKIGGIEVDVKDYQIDELNKYIGESTGGNDCPVTKPGLQVLNGKQALSYARIRYNVGDEYERTERQREVLFKIAEKIKEISPTKYLGIMNTMLDYIKTNIDPIQALNMAYTIYKFPELKMEQLQIPVTELAEGRLYKNLGWVFLMDKEQNTQILHDFIYENKIPNPDEYDYDSFNEKMAQYAQEENQYNSINGINPEDYEQNSEDVLPEVIPEDNTNNMNDTTITPPNNEQGDGTGTEDGGVVPPPSDAGTVIPPTGGETTKPESGETTKPEGDETTTPDNGGVITPGNGDTITNPDNNGENETGTIVVPPATPDMPTSSHTTITP